MRSRFITTSAALVVAAALLAGCSSGGGTSSSAVDTKPDGTGKTLTLWDYEGDTSAMGIAWKAAISEFEKETGAKVKFEAKSFQQIQSTASQVLNSNSAPDIMEYNNGNATAGLLSSEGLLTNLDAYSAAYGWDKLPASQLTQFRVADGVAGSGSLYAKPSGFTMTGLYYNKALAEKIGMTTPPASVDELTTLFGKAKEAGLVPLMASNQTGSTVMAYQLMLNSSLGVKPVSDWVFTVPDATIDTPDGVAPATVLDAWVKQGYLPEGVNGMDPTTATGQFTTGTGVFYAWGNWEAPALDKGMPGNVGFIAMPPMQTGGQVAAMSDAATASPTGRGPGWAISPGRCPRSGSSEHGSRPACAPCC